VLAALSGLSAGLLALLAAGLVAGLVVVAGERKAVEEERGRVQERERTLRRHQHVLYVQRAHQAWEIGDLPTMSDLLERGKPSPGEEDLRGFAWHYLWRLRHVPPATRLLRGHKGDVYHAAFDPEGTTLATSGKDGTVRLWDFALGRLERTILASAEDVNCVEISPDGQTLATASDDGAVRLWERSSGRQLAVLRGHAGEVISAVFSPDGKTLATGGADRVICVWDVASRRELFRLGGNNGGIQALAFAPDGETLANACMNSSPNDGGTRLWNLTDRRALFSFSSERTCRCLAFSPDGRTLAEAGGAHTQSSSVRLWDTATGRRVSTWRAHNAIIESVAFSPDGRFLATAGQDKTVRVWEVSTRATRLVVPTSQPRVWCLLFSHDGKTLVSTGSDGTVKLHDLGEILPRKPEIPMGGSGLLDLSPEGGCVAVGLAPRLSVECWDTTTGKRGPRLAHPHVQWAAFSPDGSVLVTVSRIFNRAMLWEVATGKLLSSQAIHHPDLCGVAVSPEGETVLLCGADSVARLYEGRLARPGVSFAHPEGLASVAFSPDEKVIGAAGGTQVKLWDRNTGALLRTLNHKQNVRKVAFSPDGTLLAVGSEMGGLWLWYLPKGQLMHVLTGHADSIHSLAFTPDGRTLATGSGDRTIRLWDVVLGEHLVTLEGHQSGVACLRFVRGETALVSAGDSLEGHGEVFVWSAEPAGAPAAGR
jgi:WD40 repeat protein